MRTLDGVSLVLLLKTCTQGSLINICGHSCCWELEVTDFVYVERTRDINSLVDTVVETKLWLWTVFTFRAGDGDAWREAFRR